MEGEMIVWVYDALHHFCVIMASPLYLILPGHQLLTEWHHLRHKTLPLRNTHHTQPTTQPALYLVPLWPGCSR